MSTGITDVDSSEFVQPKELVFADFLWGGTVCRSPPWPMMLIAHGALTHRLTNRCSTLSWPLFDTWADVRGQLLLLIT